MTAKGVRWASVYGAYVAAQVAEYFARLGPVPNDTMTGFVEEAAYIADMAEDSFVELGEQDR
jgi:hypothetical protein